MEKLSLAKYQNLVEMTQTCGDFHGTMDWSFVSPIPYISRICPSDSYVVHKKGKCVRIDLSLVGFEKLSWTRGEISIVFNIERGIVVILDHTRHVRQVVYPRPELNVSDGNAATEEEVSVSLNTSIRAVPSIDCSSLEIKRAKSGYIWQNERTEKIGGVDTHVWDIENIIVTCVVRNEHLKVNPLPSVDVQLQAQPATQKVDKKAEIVAKPSAKPTFTITNPDSTLEQDLEDQIADVDISGHKPGYRNIADVDTEAENDYQSWKASRELFNHFTAFRDTLDTPPAHGVVSGVYFKDCDELYERKSVYLGRALDSTTTDINLKATLWMVPPDANSADEGVKERVKVLKALADMVFCFFGYNETKTKHIMKLMTEVLSIQLPHGTPLQIDVPVSILPLAGRITFKNFQTGCDKPDSFFDIYHDGFVDGEVIVSDL